MSRACLSRRQASGIQLRSASSLRGSENIARVGLNLSRACPSAGWREIGCCLGREKRSDCNCARSPPNMALTRVSPFCGMGEKMSRESGRSPIAPVKVLRSREEGAPNGSGEHRSSLICKEQR